MGTVDIDAKLVRFGAIVMWPVFHVSSQKFHEREMN
jgi:hypothetical protein